MADIGTIMNAMRDPAGVPGSPVLFQALMVITWTLHIAFVNLTLGASGLAIFAFHNRGKPHWARLSIALTQVAKVGVSLLIVLGVAPLLFTQVIYDPQWYASNVLSGRWAIAFILTLVVAYCCWFAFYYANREGAKKHIGLYAWIAFALFCLDGLIMHALSYQELLPGQWMHWYAPGGVVDTSGASLHAIQWPRYIFIMSLGLPAVGVFLMAYAHYFEPREDHEPSYREFARALGRRLASRGFAIALVPMLAWQFAQPAASGLAWHPVGWALAAALLAMGIWTARLDAATHGYLPAAASFAVLGLLAVWREIIRAVSLKRFGYDIGNYPVHPDWPTMLLFFATLVGVGGLVGGFYLVLLYRSGRTQGHYTADKNVSRLGSAAIAVLGIWTAVFFIYGIAVWVRNSII